MMTAEPLPRSLNLKKEYIPGKKGTIWKNLFFPFVPFFLHTLELLGSLTSMHMRSVGINP